MTEDDLKVITAILKYVLFPVTAFAAGFFAKWFLQSRKSRDELLKELAPQRAEVLRALWKLTTPFARAPKEQTTLIRRAQADVAFRNWYFEEAGALFLSWRTTKRYFNAIDCLRDTASDSEALELKFSRLRTALKRDCGIYTWWNGWRQLPAPRAPLEAANQGAPPDAPDRRAGEL